MLYTSTWKLASSAEIAIVTTKPKTGVEWVESLVQRPTNNLIMETGPGLIHKTGRAQYRTSDHQNAIPAW